MGILEVRNVTFFKSRGSEFFQFIKLQPSKNTKILENQNSEPQNVLKRQILHF